MTHFSKSTNAYDESPGLSKPTGLELKNKWKMRVLGLEPKTYGLKGSKPENVNHSIEKSYKSLKNDLTANLTENDDTIQQDLTRIINRWPSLPHNIKTAILMLIGENPANE